jgi:hypothetical protein
MRSYWSYWYCSSTLKISNHIKSMDGFKGNQYTGNIRTQWLIKPPSIGGSCEWSHHPILRTCHAGTSNSNLFRTSAGHWYCQNSRKNCVLWKEFKSPVQNKLLTAANPTHSPVKCSTRTSPNHWTGHFQLSSERDLQNPTINWKMSIFMYISSFAYCIFNLFLDFFRFIIQKAN